MKIAVWLCLALLPLSAQALKLDGRLEAGIGAMALYVPDYRGADHYNVVPLPYPYVYYQGKTVQISREGLRARLFALDRLSLSMSLAATPPVRNADRPPRQGMPKLLPVFEIGPALDFQLYEVGGDSLRLRLPVRAALATDFKDFEHAGWLIEPQLRAQRRGMQLGGWRANAGANVGVLWGTADYHEHFYGVAPEFAQPGRPAYVADAGYSGLRTGMYWSFHQDPWRLVTFVQYDWLHGVAFDDSPLFKSEHAVFGGLMVMYRLYESEPRPSEEASE
ncbi:MAG TPA: MipA/OmpV family protein [Solimonas sp.]|nr:MipA/OmpV family protein [Solimonas sp.]